MAITGGSGDGHDGGCVVLPTLTRCARSVSAGFVIVSLFAQGSATRPRLGARVSLPFPTSHFPFARRVSSRQRGTLPGISSPKFETYVAHARGHRGRGHSMPCCARRDSVHYITTEPSASKQASKRARGGRPPRGRGGGQWRLPRGGGRLLPMAIGHWPLANGLLVIESRAVARAALWTSVLRSPGVFPVLQPSTRCPALERFLHRAGGGGGGGGGGGDDSIASRLDPLHLARCLSLRSLVLEKLLAASSVVVVGSRRPTPTSHLNSLVHPFRPHKLILRCRLLCAPGAS